MRGAVIVMGVAALLGAGQPARAQCPPCPALTLDDRISDAKTIFSGQPIMSVPVPAGESPFHSELSLEAPGVARTNLVTVFQVDTIWKGAPRRTVKVRHEKGECGANFKVDVKVIVFAQMDGAGVLWTRACSGNAAQGESGYNGLEDSLTNRLRYN